MSSSRVSSSIMSLVRWLAIISTAVLLSGCFVSVMPLFGPDEADYPLADGAKLAAYRLDANGKRKSEQPHYATLKRATAGYIVTPDDDKPFRAMFDDVGNGYYVAVAGDVKIIKSPNYGLFHKVGESWFAYAAICSDFAELAKAHGKSPQDFHIEASGSDCRFKSYADLKDALMFMAAYSKPTVEYVLAK